MEEEELRMKKLNIQEFDEVYALFEKAFIPAELRPYEKMLPLLEKGEFDISKRRIGFYERNGYVLNPFHYIQPTLRSNATEVNLMLMSYPESINVYSFDQIKKQIFRVVYQQMV